MINKIKKKIIGNWKCNKNLTSVDHWLNEFKELFLKNRDVNLEKIEIIICPSFLHLEYIYRFIKKNKLPIFLGAQDISAYEEGAYTGEIAASQLKEFISYTLIGHSERRKYFQENDKLLQDKSKQAIKFGLNPVFCVSKENDLIPNEIEIFAYEPVWAIGSGKAETPENAVKIISKIKTNDHQIGIYGGSVNKDNVVNYIKETMIDGVLPGGASLEALNFWELIVNAANTIK